MLVFLEKNRVFYIFYPSNFKLPLKRSTRPKPNISSSAVCLFFSLSRYFPPFSLLFHLIRCRGKRRTRDIWKVKRHNKLSPTLVPFQFYFFPQSRASNYHNGVVGHLFQTKDKSRWRTDTDRQVKRTTFCSVFYPLNSSLWIFSTQELW